MAEREFTAELDRYVVLKLTLTDYPERERPLVDGLEMVGAASKARVRDDERRLLQLYFDGWEEPFNGKLRGWRKDSPFYVVDGERLVAGVYLCSKNKFDNDRAWGQLHFAYMDPEYQGRRIYSAIFAAVVKRAREWGLDGLYLNSDRHMLPEVYERWGAVRWQAFAKGAPRPKRKKHGLWSALCALAGRR